VGEEFLCSLWNERFHSHRRYIWRKKWFVKVEEATVENDWLIMDLRRWD
jgi:hypothetical protein